MPPAPDRHQRAACHHLREAAHATRLAAAALAALRPEAWQHRAQALMQDAARLDAWLQLLRQLSLPRPPAASNKYPTTEDTEGPENPSPGVLSVPIVVNLRKARRAR